MSNKKRLILTVVGMTLGVILLIVSAYLAEEELVSPLVAVLLMVGSMAVMFVSIFHAARFEHEHSLYMCGKCGHTFKPTFKAYLWGAHTLTTRYLECPECGKKSWSLRKWIK